METSAVTLKIQGLEEKMDSRLQTLEDQNKQIMLALQKKKKGTFFGLEDENEERGNWSGRFDFFLSCLGYAVGLGNVWRFPYLCYKNGGGAFFIPYVIMLVFVGMPIFFLELSLGQFTSCGPLTCWKYAPLFQGVGLGMMVVSALVAIYYNMIIGWSIYYLFASMKSELPWETCNHEWNTEWCLDRIEFVNETTCDNRGWWSYANGTCYEVDAQAGTWIPRAIYNQKLASENEIKRILPSDEYLNRRVLKSDFSEGLGDLGPIQWELVLCYLGAFVFVVLALSKSIKSSGKVVYFTATFPYVVLVILLIRGLLLDHYKDGIDFYIVPNTDKLLNAQIWKDAAVQIFFSLSASWGGLIALSSYNRFHNDCLRDAITVSLGNCLTSLFAGFVIFSYLGELSHIINVPVDEVAESGPTLAFVVYPYALTKLPVSPLWAILFFLMLITLGVDSQFVLVETVVTSVLDRFPRLRNYKLLTVMCICAVFFLLGLTLTTQGGVYMLEVMDTYSGGWNILFIALCETISICYIYGIRRFLQDIETMLGKKICGFAPYFICKWWWAANWMFFTPLGVAAVMVYSWVDYTDMEGPKYPDWADALGWLMTLCVIVCILGGAVYAICAAEGDFSSKLRQCLNPTVEWGPALIKHRVEVAQYIPNLVVDPWGKEPQPGGVSANEIPFHMSEMKTGPPPSYNGNTNQAYEARL